MLLNCRRIFFKWVTLLYSIGLAEAAWSEALLLDYDSATFYLGYSDNSAPLSTLVSVSKQGSTASLSFTLTATSSDDGILTCYSNDKVCEAQVSALLNAPKEFWTGEVTVGFRINSGDPDQLANYVGRNILWPRTSITSSSSLTSFTSMVPTFGGIDQENFGYTSVPTGVTAYVLSSDLVGIILTLESGQQSFGNTGSGGAQTLQTFSGSVSSVTTYSNSNGAVCGIRIAHGGSSDIVHGCSSNAATVTIDSDFGFAGFSGLQLTSGAGDFVLYPLQYQLLHPRVVSWTATDSSIHFNYNVFWPTSQVTVNYNSRATRNADLSLAYVTATPDILTLNGVTVNDVTSFPFSSEVEINEGLMPCSPMSLTLQSVSVNGRVFKEQEYFAWTYGLQVTNTSTVQIADAVSGTTFTSRPTYYSQLADDQTCDEIYPVDFGLSNNQLYVNGLDLGGTFSGTATSLTNQIINKVVVYYSSTSDTLNGLAFSWNDYNYQLIGTTSGLSVEFDFTSSSGQSNILWYIETVVSGSTTQQLTFYWAQAREPVLVYTRDVSDGAAYQSTVFTSGTDANLKSIVWYNPADFSSVDLSLNGYFFASQNSFLSNFDQSQSRGRDGTAYAYQLVAGTTYDYALTGLISYVPDSNQAESTVYSYSNNGQLKTASGVQIQCTNDGKMDLQVNYEALPEVTVRFSSAGTNTEVDLGDANNLTQITQSVSEVQSQWLKENHFTYANSPINPDFSGYPAKVQVYWDNSGSCIRGLSLGYADRDGVIINEWIAGSQSGYDNSQSGNKVEVDWSGITSGYDNVPVSVIIADGGTCLAGIEFRNSNNMDISGGCMGPVDDSACSQTAFTQPSAPTGLPDYYLYGLTVGSDGSGDFIYSLSAQYASVDFPDLLARDRTCTFDWTVYPQFIRDSYFYRQFNLDSDPLQCGSSREVVDIGVADNVTVNVLYEQRVSRSRDDPAAKALTSQNQLTITRFNDWHVSAFCYYNGEGIETGQVKTIQEADQAAAGTNQFQFSMNVYFDNTFQDFYTSQSPPMILGEPMYVMVTGDFNLQNFQVVATDCKATKTSNPDDAEFYTIEADTCAADDSFERDTPPIHLADAFHFNAFAWFDESSDQVLTASVYLHCDVRACPEGESFCDITDPTACGSRRRRRRSLYSDNDSPPKGSKMVKVRSKQPIQIIRPGLYETLKVDRGMYPVDRSDPELSSHQALLAFLFLLTTFTLSLYLAIRLLKLRRSRWCSNMFSGFSQSKNYLSNKVC